MEFGPLARVEHMPQRARDTTLGRMAVTSKHAEYLLFDRYDVWNVLACERAGVRRQVMLYNIIPTQFARITGPTVHIYRIPSVRSIQDVRN